MEIFDIRFKEREKIKMDREYIWKIYDIRGPIDGIYGDFYSYDMIEIVAGEEQNWYNVTVSALMHRIISDAVRYEIREIPDKQCHIIQYRRYRRENGKVWHECQCIGICNRE